MFQNQNLSKQRKFFAPNKNDPSSLIFNREHLPRLCFSINKSQEKRDNLFDATIILNDFHRTMSSTLLGEITYGLSLFSFEYSKNLDSEIFVGGKNLHKVNIKSVINNIRPIHPNEKLELRNLEAGKYLIEVIIFSNQRSTIP